MILCTALPSAIMAMMSAAVRIENPEIVLFNAVIRGQTAIIDSLLKLGIRVDLSRADGTQALHVAAANNQKNAAKLLLEKGASVGAKEAHGTTPLMFAAAMGHKEMASILLAHGAQVNAEGVEGTTALFDAAEADDPAMIEFLYFLFDLFRNKC